MGQRGMAGCQAAEGAASQHTLASSERQHTARQGASLLTLR
jgi:hypothetical protein